MARENGAGVSLQRSGAKRRVCDAVLSKCKKIEQNGNDLPRSGFRGGAARVRERGPGSGRDARSVSNRGNAKEWLNSSTRPKKSGIVECALPVGPITSVTPIMPQSQ